MDKETREMFELIINKLDRVGSRLDGVESRQNEIFHVVKVIEHANKVHKAEIDSVKVMTDYHEGTPVLHNGQFLFDVQAEEGFFLRQGIARDSIWCK